MGKKLKKSPLNPDIFRDIEVDSLKRYIDIVDLFNEFGVKLEKKGQSYMGLCPFHDDKNPSLSVTREKGLYQCFGCGESGDILNLTMFMKNCDFPEALEFLNAKAGNIKRSKPLEPIVIDEEKETKEPYDLTRVIEYYHKRLFESKEAQEYLKSRGFINPELFTRFKIGFADGTLPSKLSNEQKKELQTAGVLNTKGNEKFYKRLIFPVFDDVGIGVDLYGRIINDTSTVKHLYLAGEHREIFNNKVLKVYDEIILTESIIDCLSLIEIGIENVIPAYGVNGFKDVLIQKLKDNNIRTVIIAFDNDEAGKKAVGKLKEALIAEGLKVKSIYSPNFKDWNEELLNGLIKDEVLTLIEKAEYLTSDEKKEIEEDNTKDFEVKELNGRYIFTINGIKYTLTGVKETFVSSLRVNIKAEYEDRRHYDNLNLYVSKARKTYSASLSHDFEVQQKRVENDLFTILNYLEDMRDRALEEKEEKEIILTEEEKQLGLSFLTSDDLFDIIIDDLTSLGYVGDDLNKQLLYLCASSRKLDNPISVLIVSQSASGKSYLVDTVKRFIPEEDVIAVHSLSDQALNYMNNLLHKFLVFGEAIHNGEVEHQIREMLSSKELSRLKVSKDEKTGKMITENIRKEVVVANVMSTTNNNINPENASRYFLINTDESKEQTKRIHEAQRKKYTLDKHKHKKESLPHIIKKHHAAQRLLRKLSIVNPYAHLLDFPVSTMRMRRDHDRFLDLIAVIAFIRQFQKEIKIHESIEYIDCDLIDYSKAREIMVNGVLASTMGDLPKGALNLYELIREMVKEKAEKENIIVVDVKFIQREVREFTGLGADTVRKYMKNLVDYEYLTVTSGESNGTRKSYRLRADEEIGTVDLSIIPTVEELKRMIEEEKRLRT